MSVDYSAIMLYGYKLTPEEVTAVGVDKLRDLKAQYEDEPMPIGLICDNDVVEGGDWYIGRWIENSTTGYQTSDFASIDDNFYSAINRLMAEICNKEPFWNLREGKEPAWYLFVRCW